MKLYMSGTSPYVRKARVTTREKGLEGAIEEVLCNPFDDPAALAAVNPLGRVPALVLDDGTGLYDSPLICGHLDGLGDGPRLIPEDPAGRLAVLRAQALADGLMDNAVALTMEGRRPEGERSPATMERWRGQIRAAVAAMDGDLPALPDGVTLGHIACACALSYLDFRHGALAWRDGHPALAAWHEAFARRPSMEATAFVA